MYEYRIANAEPERRNFYDDLKYWSNSCGKLHHHGEYDIDESGLPEGLRSAYNELWTSENGSLCYLVEDKGTYGIALFNEFDDCFANDINCTMDNLFEPMQKKQNLYSEMGEFKLATLILGENTGCFGCHAFIIILPWNVGKKPSMPLQLF